jgi:uncharacterized protein YbbC (DUF1343 family)
MMRRPFPSLLLAAAALAALAWLAGCASEAKPKEKPKPVVIAPLPVPAAPVPPPEKLPLVMLGIDVLEADGFKAIAGKKIGLLTHRAGVNRRGESTINVLLRAPQSKLVCLFAPEHGLDGQIKASVNFEDMRHTSGLPVYSLHGANRKPTKEQLKGLDAVVIDLQDIGSRSYTFNVVMRYTMDSCFEHGVEVIVLDRPNPLGGLKVDGPGLDAEWANTGVGAFRIPYVHGLTMGELATMAKNAPRVMAVTEKVRARGKLTVIMMRGWNRAMRWPDTGLEWVPTSPMIPNFDAAVGYAMVGLGTNNPSFSGWSSGIGKDYPFRGINFPKKTPDEIIKAMEAYNIPGVRFVKRQGTTADGKPANGVYVEVTDWDKCRPTEVSCYMHKQAAKWEKLNPFAALTQSEQRTFQIHMGSTAWHDALRREGARVDVAAFIKNWSERAAIFQQSSKKYWLYP